eukprot:gene18129-biopygen22711
MRKPQQEETEEAEKGVGRVPEDCDSKERRGYYAYLVNKYKDRKGVWDEEGRKVIWTDGSAVKDDSGVMRAGAGVFYGVGNESNRALAVTGLQSNQRAELTAALHVLEEEEGPVHIRTDSRYVQLGIEVWRHKWRSKAWYKKAKFGIE